MRQFLIALFLLFSYVPCVWGAIWTMDAQNVQEQEIKEVYNQIYEHFFDLNKFVEGEIKKGDSSEVYKALKGQQQFLTDKKNKIQNDRTRIEKLKSSRDKTKSQISSIQDSKLQEKQQVIKNLSEILHKQEAYICHLEREMKQQPTCNDLENEISNIQSLMHQLKNKDNSLQLTETYNPSDKVLQNGSYNNQCDSLCDVLLSSKGCLVAKENKKN